MLIIKKLSYSYYSNHIIQYADFSFSTGITIIHGKSGSGKSTLLEMIAKIKTYQGDIIWQEKNINTIPNDLYYKKIISFVPQGAHLSPYFTLRDYYTLLSKNIKSYNNLIDHLDMTNHLDQTTTTLSGGQKYKMALMIAITKETPLLLLDEPTAHLDAENTKKIIEILEHIKKNKVIIMATHDRQLLQNQTYQYYEIQNTL
jgi:putative ABC transport system ATP-binding protein